MFKKIIAKKSNYKFICLIALNLLLISISNAATFTVNTTNDTIDANAGNGICADSAGNCSLRAAIGETNQLATVVATRINTITLPAGIYTLTITGGSEFLNASGDLNIRNSSNLTINGDNARTTIIQAGTIKSTNATDGDGIDRVIGIFNSGAVILSLNNLSVRNGKRNFVGSVNDGGGVLYRAALSSGGGLNINNCAFLDNAAEDNGGGISSDTNTNITNSLIAGNVAFSGTDFGGGMFFAQTETASATLNLTNTTISGNSINNATNGGIGGGLFVGRFNVAGLTSTANITNCTITGNTAIGTGGRGGGIAAQTAVTTRLRNTIVAGNQATTSGPDFSLSPNGTMSVVSGGTNLIGNDSSSTGWIGSDLLNNLTSNLGALANNGGETDTHAVPTGSSALNAGQNCVVDSTCATFNAPANVTTDQRGENRLIDGFTQQFALFVDIGAYEKLAPTAANVSISGRVFAENNQGLRNAVVTLTDSNGQTHTTRTTSFGYFTFEEIEVGQTVIIGVRSKRFQFAPQVFSVNEQLEGLNFLPKI